MYENLLKHKIFLGSSQSKKQSYSKSISKFRNEFLITNSDVDPKTFDEGFNELLTALDTVLRINGTSKVDFLKWFFHTMNHLIVLIPLQDHTDHLTRKHSEIESRQRRLLTELCAVTKSLLKSYYDNRVEDFFLMNSTMDSMLTNVNEACENRLQERSKVPVFRINKGPRRQNLFSYGVKILHHGLSLEIKTSKVLIKPAIQIGNRRDHKIFEKYRERKLNDSDEYRITPLRICANTLYLLGIPNGDYMEERLRKKINTCKIPLKSGG